MIQIDMQMPDNCMNCRFRDEVQSSCIAAGDPGFCVFVGLSKSELVEWEDWKRKASSGRDPRCPLRQECKGCSIVFDVAYKAGKEDSIVRCKDCKSSFEKNGMYFCKSILSDRNALVDRDWFCADGEER